MSLDQLATPDSAELLVMFNTAAAESAAAWAEQETEEDRIARALEKEKADAFFKRLLAEDEQRGIAAGMF